MGKTASDKSIEIEPVPDVEVWPRVDISEEQASAAISSALNVFKEGAVPNFFEDEMFTLQTLDCIGCITFVQPSVTKRGKVLGHSAVVVLKDGEIFVTSQCETSNRAAAEALYWVAVSHV